MKSSLAAALKSLKQNRSILLLDDAAGQCAGYLVCSAASVTPEQIAVMANHARGVVCAPLPESRIRDLGLPMMSRNQGGIAPDFTVSVEARQGVTTGISAADRAHTLKVLATTKHAKLDLVMPGHIFPLRAKNGGVLLKGAPAEAAVDLLNMAELPSTAVMTQCLAEDGGLPKEDQLLRTAKELGLESVRLSAIIAARLSSESILERVAESRLPTFEHGEFRAICFRSKTDGAEHLALVTGEIPPADTKKPVLVRVQAEHRLGDLLGGTEPGSRARLQASMKKIHENGHGALIYIRHPKSGRIRTQLLNAPNTADNASQLRQLGVGAQILKNLGIQRIRLLSNSTREFTAAEAFGIEIVDKEPL